MGKVRSPTDVLSLQRCRILCKGRVGIEVQFQRPDFEGEAWVSAQNLVQLAEKKVGRVEWMECEAETRKNVFPRQEVERARDEKASAQRQPALAIVRLVLGELVDDQVDNFDGC